MDGKERVIRKLRRSWLIKTGIFAAAAVFVFTFIFGAAYAPSDDMFPAVRAGDLVLYFRPGQLLRNDVVLYEVPGGACHIGRIAGAEGDVAGASEGGLLTLNGNILPVMKRSGICERTLTGARDISGEIGEGEYLILGDSRETAEDSRVFGLISRRAVKGKVFTIIRRGPL